MTEMDIRFYEEALVAVANERDRFKVEADEAREARNAAEWGLASALEQIDGLKRGTLSLSIQHDPLAISALLDDNLRERELYHRLVYDIRKVLGEDGLHAQLKDLPSLIASKIETEP